MLLIFLHRLKTCAISKTPINILSVNLKVLIGSLKIVLVIALKQKINHRALWNFYFTIISISRYEFIIEAIIKKIGPDFQQNWLLIE